MAGDEPGQGSADTAEHAISRRRFGGVTGVWAGTLALGRVARAPRARKQGPRGAGTRPADRASRFLDQFDRKPPYSFLYGGQPSTVLLARWAGGRHRRGAGIPARLQHGRGDPL